MSYQVQSTRLFIIL